MGVTHKRRGSIEVLVVSDPLRSDGIAYLRESYPPDNPLLPYAVHSARCAVKIEENRWVNAGMAGEMVKIDCNCGLDAIAQDMLTAKRNLSQGREVGCCVVPDDIAERMSNPKSARAAMLRLGPLTKYQQSRLSVFVALVQTLRATGSRRVKAFNLYLNLKVQTEFPDNPDCWEEMRTAFRESLIKKNKKIKGNEVLSLSKIASEMRDYLESNPVLVAWKCGNSGVRSAFLCYDLYQAIITRISLNAPEDIPERRCPICSKILLNDQQKTCSDRCRKQKERLKMAA